MSLTRHLPSAQYRCHECVRSCETAGDATEPPGTQQAASTTFEPAKNSVGATLSRQETSTTYNLELSVPSFRHHRVQVSIGDIFKMATLLHVMMMASLFQGSRSASGNTIRFFTDQRLDLRVNMQRVVGEPELVGRYVTNSWLNCSEPVTSRLHRATVEERNRCSPSPPSS
jgi:hypothetical protein